KPSYRVSSPCISMPTRMRRRSIIPEYHPLRGLEFFPPRLFSTLSQYAKVAVSRQPGRPDNRNTGNDSASQNYRLSVQPYIADHASDSYLDLYHPTILIIGERKALIRHSSQRYDFHISPQLESVLPCRSVSPPSSTSCPSCRPRWTVLDCAGFATISCCSSPYSGSTERHWIIRTGTTAPS